MYVLIISSGHEIADLEKVIGPFLNEGAARKYLVDLGPSDRIATIMPLTLT